MHKLSIITVALNNKLTIEHCINSVREQRGVDDVEHVIIDGCSSDGTMEIARRCCMDGTCMVSEPDSGIYDAMNKGISRATGDIIGILNADDFYAADDILADVKRVFMDEDVDSCYGDLLYVDAVDTDRVVRYWKSGAYNPRRFYRGWMPPHPTFFVRKEIYDKYGLFNLELGTAADYEIMLRFLLKKRITTAYIPRVMVKMRTGGASNISIRTRLKANRMDRKAWRINGLRPYPWTLALKPLRKTAQWIMKP